MGSITEEVVESGKGDVAKSKDKATKEVDEGEKVAEIVSKVSFFIYFSLQFFFQQILLLHKL